MLNPHPAKSQSFLRPDLHSSVLGPPLVVSPQPRGQKGRNRDRRPGSWALQPPPSSLPGPAGRGEAMSTSGDATAHPRFWDVFSVAVCVSGFEGKGATLVKEVPRGGAREGLGHAGVWSAGGARGGGAGGRGAGRSGAGARGRGPEVGPGTAEGAGRGARTGAGQGRDVASRDPSPETGEVGGKGAQKNRRHRGRGRPAVGAWGVDAGGGRLGAGGVPVARVGPLGP